MEAVYGYISCPGCEKMVAVIIGVEDAQFICPCGTAFMFKKKE